jgi:DNA-directed RNA polymerase specialized sigma24 family protein
MTTEPGDVPGHRSALRVQPAPGEPVPGDWLAEYEDTAAVRRLDEAAERLAADQDLVTSLGLQGYKGKDYTVFETELAKYGIAVIGGWIRRGLIFAKCKERGLGGLPQPIGDALRDHDTVDELTGETVAKALVHFRTDVLLRGRWVSNRGATLRTFFVGQCLFRFANVYRAWHAKEQPLDPEDAFELDDRQQDGPEDRVIDLREVERGLAHVKDARLKTALVLMAAGHTQADAALRLGVTEKTVERMVANHRARMKNKGIA